MTGSLLSDPALAGPPLLDQFPAPRLGAATRVVALAERQCHAGGIDKDLDWMARIGIGGVQNFDANLATPQIVDKRLVYMQPDWQAAFRHAVTTADAKGLDFTIASPGWSETGAWVPAADGMKKLVWSQTIVTGQAVPWQAGQPAPNHRPVPTLPSNEPFPSGPQGGMPQARARSPCWPCRCAMRLARAAPVHRGRRAADR
jgi:hypothetical protein